MDQSKLSLLLTSRKFWSLITALVTLAVAYQTGQMPLPMVELSAVSALAAYSVATGIEDAGQAQARAAPPTTNVTVTPASGPKPLLPGSADVSPSLPIPKAQT